MAIRQPVPLRIIHLDRQHVRHVIPWRGNYKREDFGRGDDLHLSSGGERDQFLWHLRPLFERADRISIVAAFVKTTGLRVLARPLLLALRRGARLRLLTGDYLQITDVEALGLLLSWCQGADPAAAPQAASS